MPKANAKSSAADFAVGRGKPPSHYRFKPRASPAIPEDASEAAAT